MNVLNNSTQKCHFLRMCYKGIVLYSVASSLSDHSKCFTLYTLAYLFIPTQIWLLLEAFSHAVITVQRLHSR